ncbi:hemagglutination activity protein, partial [Pasteurella multocida]
QSVKERKAILRDVLREQQRPSTFYKRIKTRGAL